MDISKTPIGPFQRIVLEFNKTSLKISLDLGPASRPCQSSGISIILHSFLLASLLKSSAITTSVGRYTSTLCCLAFSKISKAKDNLSSSTIDFPILPPRALIKVNDIPPPMIRLSTAGRIFSIIVIFVETLEPPSIAVTGFSPDLRTLSIAISSFSISKPKNLVEGKN